MYDEFRQENERSPVDEPKEDGVAFKVGDQKFHFNKKVSTVSLARFKVIIKL